MPTNDALIPVTFAGGIDTKTDRKAVIPGKLLNIENGVFTKSSIIQKRNGVERLGTTVFGSGTISATPGAALNVFQNELTINTGNRMYSRSESNDALVDRGVAVSVQVTNQQVQGASNRDILRATSTVNQSIGVYAWWDGVSIWISIIDEKSGACFAVQNVSQTLIPNGSLQLFNAGNAIYLVFGAGGNLYCYQLPVLNPRSFFFISTLAADADAANPMLDIIEFGSNAFCAYRNNSGNISLMFITRGNVATVSQGYPGVVSISETASNCLSVLTDGISVYVVWHNSLYGTRVQGFDAHLVALFSPLTIDSTTGFPTVNITGYVLNGAVTLFYEVRSSIDINQRVNIASFTKAGAITSSATTFKRSVGLMAKAFTYNGQGYVPCVFNSATQPTYFIFSSAGNRVAKLVDDEAGSYGIRSFLSRSNVSSTNGSLFTFANLNKVQVSSDNGGLYFNRGVNKSSVEFGTNNAFAAAQLGQNLHVIGGSLMNYDGRTITEHGFDVYPEGQSLSASISTTGGSIGSGSVLPGGIYSYYFTYRWLDGQGQLHESAPSFAQQLVLSGSTNAVTWTIPTLRVTDKVSGSIAVYRSQQDASPIVPYMLTNLSGVFNDPNMDSISFTDQATDSAIANNAILYSVGPNGPGGAGSPVENDAPPACSAICTNKNRLWVISSESPNRLFFSKEFVPTNGVCFSLGFFVDMDPQGGPATALASMLNQLIIFKQSSIYLLIGDGPDATGANNDYGLPQLVSSDVGCINPASIVVTSQGIFFQSQKGIYLLNTGLQAPVYVGAEVEAYNDYQITSATLLTNVNQVRFTLMNGPTLVYDKFVGQWSTFTGLHQNLIDTIVYNNVYTILNGNGGLYRENPTLYQDDNQNVFLVLETAWIKLDPRVLQGFQRVKKIHLLGTLGSRHKLFVEVAYDYNEATLQSMVFDTSQALNNSTWGSDNTYGSGSLWGSQNSQNNGPTDSIYQFKDNLTHQKCQAIKFRFSDAFSGSLGAGYAINELLLTVGLKKGGFKLPGSKTI